MQTITSLSAEQKYLIQATFPKIAMRCDTIGDLFYSQLYWADQSLISSSNKKAKDHGKLLVQLLGKAVSCLDEPDTLLPALQEIGLRYVGANGEKKHYQLFGTALISTLELVLGGSVFTPDVKAAWTSFNNLVAEVGLSTN